MFVGFLRACLLDFRVALDDVVKERGQVLEDGKRVGFKEIQLGHGQLSLKLEVRESVGFVLEDRLVGLHGLETFCL